MKYVVISSFIVILLLFIIGIFGYSIIQLKREWPSIKEAWRRMDVLEKNMLILGFLIFIFIPALKSHPSADWYFAKIMIEILPALAGSFFVAGVISFMTQVHKIRNNS